MGPGQTAPGAAGASFGAGCGLWQRLPLLAHAGVGCAAGYRPRPLAWVLRLVLDVGCGHGYPCWRMVGAGAQRAIVIVPSPRFVVPFQAIKTLAGTHHPIDVLPVGIEALPPNLHAFDTVFSMGALYHRRSPMDHLRELKDALRPGGQLVRSEEHTSELQSRGHLVCRL